MTILKTFYNLGVRFVVRSCELKTFGGIPRSDDLHTVFSQRNHVKLDVCPESLIVKFYQTAETF